MVEFVTVSLDVRGYVRLLSKLERIRLGIERKLKSDFFCTFSPN